MSNTHGGGGKDEERHKEESSNGINRGDDTAEGKKQYKARKTDEMG